MLILIFVDVCIKLPTCVWNILLNSFICVCANVFVINQSKDLADEKRCVAFKKTIGKCVIYTLCRMLVFIRRLTGIESAVSVLVRVAG